MQLLEKKVGMVTGGGSGIGRATCLRFAAEGARVLVVDIHPENGEATASKIKTAGGDALFTQADVTNEDEIIAAVELARKELGGLHIASNNAALSVGSALLADYATENFEKTYQATLFSVFYCMKHQIPAMIEDGGGAIVNIGSRAADTPNFMTSAYDSAKSAVNGLTRSAAKEYATKGIRVNCINPGVVLTEGVKKYFAEDPNHEARLTRGISMNRLAEPDELAEAVAWLCSERASYITGASLNVDGGAFN